MTEYQPDGWRRKNVNWFTLRIFGQSKVASFTIAAPFVGYVILYHDMLRPYLGGLGGLLQREHAGESCGPWIAFIDKLHFVYLGLLCLGVGTIVYRFFANQVIQSFANISDYVEREEQHITARNLRSMFETIRSRRTGMKNQFLDRAPWLEREKVSLKVASDTYARNGDPNVAKDVLRSYYNVLNRYSSRFLVYLATVAYCIGFLLLSIPGLFFTGRVLCTLLIRS